jgi:type I restriction enzyme S subunit
MKKDLTKYPAYKPAGIDFIDEIPEGWEISPLKRIATVRTGVAKGRKFDNLPTVWFPYLRVANVQDGYLDLTDVAEIEILAAEVERFSLKKGDVLMNEGGDADKLGRGHVWEGKIDPCLHQNHVFAIRCKGLLPLWLSIVTGSLYAKAYFETKAKRTTNLASISKANLSEFPVVLPPLEEQKIILAFLGQETAKIDRLADVRRKQIERLQEQRAAVIHHTVTKGLDPAAKMKTSGIEWLEDVNFNWNLYRIKHLGEVIAGGTPKSGEVDYWDGNIVWLTPADLGKEGSRYLFSSLRKITSLGQTATGLSLAPKGSLVISTRAPVGSLNILGVPATTNQGCKCIVLDEKRSDSRYFFYLISLAILF